MSFSSIPTRDNVSSIYYSWFNDLRTAGIAVENYLGTGYVIETTQAITNEESDQVLTGLIFDSSSVKAGIIDALVIRTSTTEELVSMGKILVYYNPISTAWQIIDMLSGEFDDKCTFTINSSGQVLCTTVGLTGSSYSGNIYFKANTLGSAV